MEWGRDGEEEGEVEGEWKRVSGKRKGSERWRESGEVRGKVKRDRQWSKRNRENTRKGGTGGGNRRRKWKK